MLRTVNIKRFLAEESGSLLVFFAVCVATLLGVLALSFDLGRRAATQTDMQSFADNVALAAAKELDGTSTSITRAKLAATTLIAAANERLKGGTAGSNFTITFSVDDDMFFYDVLPDSDTPTDLSIAGLSASKYTLPPSTKANGNNPTAPEDVQFVGVRLDTVDVPWIFANFFDGTGQPDEAIAAVAIAGNTAYTCDVAPLFFCMPRQVSGTDVGPIIDMQPGWSLLLRSGGNDAEGPGGGKWKPGNFGFLDISDVPIDEDGECDDPGNPNRREACLLNIIQRTNACYPNRGVNMDPGQSRGIEDAMFNMRFDKFLSSMKGFEGERNYAPGPHVVRGEKARNSNKTICNAQNIDPTGNTMPFPEDDCHIDDDCAGYSYGRVGDGDWDVDLYVNTNYGMYDPDNLTDGAPTLIADSGIGGVNPKFDALAAENTYWRDRGFAPEYDKANFPDFRFDGYATMSRYDFYKKEIIRAETQGDMGEDANGNIITETHEAAWTNIWTDTTVTDDAQTYFDDTLKLYPILPYRDGDNGLPQCGDYVSDLASTDGVFGADRRVFTIAGIDCGPGGLTDFQGNAQQVNVRKYYRAFMMKPVGFSTSGTNSVFDIWLEIIEEIGDTGVGETIDRGIFREVVQLYK